LGAIKSATHFNPAIRTFYARLVKAGTPGKPALTAVMRKLMVVLNAIGRTSASLVGREHRGTYGADQSR